MEKGAGERPETREVARRVGIEPVKDILSNRAPPRFEIGAENVATLGFVGRTKPQNLRRPKTRGHVRQNPPPPDLALASVRQKDTHRLHRRFDEKAKERFLGDPITAESLDSVESETGVASPATGGEKSAGGLRAGAEKIKIGSPPTAFAHLGHEGPGQMRFAAAVGPAKKKDGRAGAPPLETGPSVRSQANEERRVGRSEKVGEALRRRRHEREGFPTRNGAPGRSPARPRSRFATFH